MNTLPGKTALVTGGAQGIGLGIVRLLLERGMRVVAADIDQQACDELTVDSNGKELLVVSTDVADEDSVKRCIAKTIDRFGCLDALVNNAALTSANFAPPEELSLETWNQVLAVNLTGAFLITKEAIPHLKKTKGAVVNIASTRALQSEPFGEAYAASKGGLVSLTHALAVSLGPEIRVNCISPGWIETRDWQKSSARQTPVHSEADKTQHPVGRVGVPDDIAAMIAYLIGAESGFITGQNFVVDGGMTRKMIYAE